MPEKDPIEQLEQFRTGGFAVPPLSPDEVRRRGDRRRARRRTAVTAGIAVVLVAVAVPAAVLRDAGDDSDRVAATPSEEITYPGDGVFIASSADTGKLTGTSEPFRLYIANLADELNADSDSCPGAATGITVRKYSTRGYALGAVNNCGGYVALWVDRDGVWQEGMGTQDAWDCAALSYLRVPRSFAGECFREAGGFGPEEVAGLRLGMTAKQVVQAGGEVSDAARGSDAGTCRGVRLPYREALPDQDDGVFSDAQGLVAVFARPDDRTPERIGLGSTEAELRAAYPTARKGQNGYWVLTVPGAVPAEYQFGIEADGTVGEMLLTRSDQQCFG